MFCTSEDFDLPPYNIPNLDNVVNTFADFISSSERKQLSYALGGTLYDAFISGLNNLPQEWNDFTEYQINEQVVYGNAVYQALAINTNILPTDIVIWGTVEASNRWLAIKNGSGYSANNRRYSYLGLKEMCIPMIYSLWLRYQIDNQVASLSTVKAKTENSVAVSPNVRICESWNDYVLQMSGAYLYCGSFKIANLYVYLIASSDLYLADVNVLGNDYASLDAYLYAEGNRPGRQNIFDL